MSHIREMDGIHSTVLMVQVENEPGMLGDSRDRCAAADAAFSKPVPEELTALLNDDWESLHPHMRQTLSAAGFDQGRSEAGGNWESTFGESEKTDELFMAYHFAKYVEHVAKEGKQAYPLPLFTNVWMNYALDDEAQAFPVVAGGGGRPGDYPSGGATSNVLDIWQMFAPALDFIAPDIYLNDYSRSCANYRHRNQPLLIPEQRRDAYGARRIWTAYGSFAALGTSPFGIDTMEPTHNPFAGPYGLLQSVSGIVLEAQSRPGSSIGFFLDEIPADGNDTCKPIVHCFGEYELTIQRSFVFGKPGPGSGMVIHRGGGIFLLLGSGFQVRARSVVPSATFTGILRFEEKTTTGGLSGSLRTLRTLNGDETRSGQLAIMPNEDPDYGDFPICVTIPAKTMIAELEVYYLKDD
jgi:hypothetical protein